MHPNFWRWPRVISFKMQNANRVILLLWQGQVVFQRWISFIMDLLQLQTINFQIFDFSVRNDNPCVRRFFVIFWGENSKILFRNWVTFQIFEFSRQNISAEFVDFLAQKFIYFHLRIRLLFKHLNFRAKKTVVSDYWGISLVFKYLNFQIFGDVLAQKFQLFLGLSEMPFCMECHQSHPKVSFQASGWSSK